MNLFKYTYLKLVVTFSFFFYVVLAISFDEPFFWDWSAAQSTPFFIIIFSLFGPVALTTIFKKLMPDNPENSDFFDFIRYNGLKPMDAISDHYTNVATIAVLFTVFIYTGTKLISNFDNGATGVLIASVYLLLIFIYIPYALRLMFYVQSLEIAKFFQLLIAFCILSFDSYLIQVFIETAPKFISVKVP